MIAGEDNTEFIESLTRTAIEALGLVFQMRGLEKLEAEDLAKVWVNAADAAVHNMRKILDR